MTPLILQSDIEAARKMIAERRSEADVLTMLVQRRIDPAKAEQLVRDLVQGLPVRPDMQANQEARYKGGSNHHQPSSETDETQPAPKRQHRHSGHSHSKKGISWLIPLLVVLIGAAVYFGVIRSSKPAGNLVPSAAGGDSNQPVNAPNPQGQAKP